MLKEIVAKKLVTPAVRREAVAQVRVAFEVSERRPCSALGVDRTSVRYRSGRPDDAKLSPSARIGGLARKPHIIRTLHNATDYFPNISVSEPVRGPVHAAPG